MKICAVICEYNPFHTGHLYQLLEASKRFDATICLMSGNFVQRAEPAVAEKHVRARLALDSGAAMVLELPIVYATANGERFASGAIKTLKQLKDINSLVMGCETDDVATLKKLAEIQLNEDETFKEILSSTLSEGYSYASALTKATTMRAAEQNITGSEAEAILSLPNNLLCIEYIKAIAKNGLSVEPVLIKRKGNDYNSISAKGNYISATALRKLLNENDFTAAIPYLTNEYELLLNEFRAHKPDCELFEKIAAYTLRAASPEAIAECFDCREGIEYRLYENALKFIKLKDILEATKTKRYTMSRLKRIVLQLMLGIMKELLSNEPVIPTRLLAVKEAFKPYLTDNAEKMIIRGSDVDRYKGDYFDKYFEVEKRAAALYSAITSNDSNLYVPQKLYSR